MANDTQKLNGRSILKSVLKRSLHPRHLVELIKLRLNHRSTLRVYADPQLKLYGEVFLGDFLNYGHFENPELEPYGMSLNDIHHAQARNAELVLELIVDRSSPILDVGSGMGGLVRLMLNRGMNPVALSPDRNQVQHLRQKYPQLTVIESRFEDVPLREYQHRFGTIITSESLQFLKLRDALPVMEQLLKPGGRWIACDCFRTGEERHRSSGQVWSDFERQVLAAGWKLTFLEDHTANVMPTLRFLHMWGEDIIYPAVRFGFDKFRTKQPLAHYVFEEVIGAVTKKIDKNLDLINPPTYARYTRYMLLALERAA